MADFRARIMAELDGSRIQGDLDRIGQNHTLTLSNLAVDQSGINNVIRQIQRSLDNHQFNISINLPNIQRQVQQAGGNSGNNFANGIRQGISNVTNNAIDEIQRMRNILANMNFDIGSIDVVTRDLNQMNLAINRIVTNIDQNGNIRISVRGINEFGDAVTQIRQFENDSGQIRNLGRTIAQSFDTGEAAARAFREETQYAYSRMRELNKEYQQLRIAELKLDPQVDIHQIDELHRQIQLVADEYNALHDLFEDRLTPFQQNNLWRDASKFDSALNRTSAKIEDSENARDINRAYSQLYNNVKKIAQIRGRLLDLDADEDTNEIAALNEQLRELRALHNSLRAITDGNLSAEQKRNLDILGIGIRNERRVHEAELADSARLEREKIVADALTDSYNELYTTAQRIGKVRIDIAKLDAEKNTSEIEVLNNHLEELRNTYNTLKISLSEKLSVEQFQRLQRVIIDTEDEIERLNAKRADKVGKLASVSQIGNLDSKMAIWLSKNTAAAKDYGESIEVLQRRLRELSATGNMLESDLKDIAQEFNDITVSATLAGKTGKSFALSMQDAARRIVQYISIDQVFDHLIDATVDMARNVYDIDTAMTGLMKVTDETSDRYNKFLKTSAASAKDLKRSISGIVEQSAEWAKLGFSIDEAEELAKISSIYANVADVDDKTAVGDIVTTLKAYFSESSDVVGDATIIIDAMNQLGNQFATDAASLGEGLSRAASSMHVAGTDMYQTLAMLTGGAEITQNAGEFGNFLKVASMRIRGMTGELEALGEEVDESVESISKVQTQILNLTHGKVNIFDSEGEFRNYFEVMKEIADVMDELSSIEQASMTELLFGKQRGNQGAALIQAFQSGQIEKAYQSALKSSGSAMAEQEKWSESLQAHLGELKATWQEVSQTFLDSEFLKNAVDVATLFLEKLVDIGEFLDGDGIFGSFGLFPTVISGIVGAVASFKNVGRDKMFSLRTCRLL